MHLLLTVPTAPEDMTEFQHTSTGLKAMMCVAEPPHFKGGRMYKSLNGKGEHVCVDWWRGIFLADVLGQKVQQLQRGWLLPQALPALGILQSGGDARHRRTTMVVTAAQHTSQW